MECPDCLGSCGGACPTCEGACGSGKSTDICLPKEDFIKEHKDLIGLLEKVGKEGEKQKAELEAKVGVGGCQSCGCESTYKGLPTELLDAFLLHMVEGRDLERLKVFETPKQLVFHVGWKGTPQQLDTINKLFKGFKFGRNGRFSAVKGRLFLRDAMVFSKILNSYQAEVLGRLPTPPSRRKRGGCEYCKDKLDGP